MSEKEGEDWRDDDGIAVNKCGTRQKNARPVFQSFSESALSVGEVGEDSNEGPRKVMDQSGGWI
jgi:hypothetical protein